MSTHAEKIEAYFRKRSSVFPNEMTMHMRAIELCIRPRLQLRAMMKDTSAVPEVWTLKVADRAGHVTTLERPVSLYSYRNHCEALADVVRFILEKLPE